MNLKAYARLLHTKINSAHKKARNPFMDSTMYNPFRRELNTTLVWIEPEENIQNEFNHIDRE